MLGESQEIHQRGDAIMQQGVLPFQYEIEGSPSGMTALAGLPAFLDLTAVSGLRESIGRHVQVRGGSRGQGWADAQQVMALVLLNLAGGDCVDDLRTLSKDEGFCRVLMRMELAGLPRRERRETERRWRREKRRAVPSPSAVFRYLGEFHDPEQERARHAEGAPDAFIPAPNEALQGLALVNRDLLAFDAAQGVDETATLDLDATLIYTEKETAQYCYKHRPAYQPLNVYWAEQQTMLHTEFRDGNVPAGHQQLRVFQEALRYLPSQVKRVRTRSDTAGYQHEFLRYCEQGEDPRFEGPRVSLSGHPRSACGAGDSGHRAAAGTAVPVHDPRRAVLQALRHRDQHGLGRRAADCLATRALRQERGGSRGAEERPGGRTRAVSPLRGERGMVEDRGPCLQPALDHEAAGPGAWLGGEATEGDPVLPDPPVRPGAGACPSAHRPAGRVTHGGDAPGGEAQNLVPGAGFHGLTAGRPAPQKAMTVDGGPDESAQKEPRRAASGCPGPLTPRRLRLPTPAAPQRDPFRPPTEVPATDRRWIWDQGNPLTSRFSWGTVSIVFSSQEVVDAP